MRKYEMAGNFSEGETKFMWPIKVTDDGDYRSSVQLGLGDSANISLGNA